MTVAQPCDCLLGFSFGKCCWLLRSSRNVRRSKEGGEVGENLAIKNLHKVKSHACWRRVGGSSWPLTPSNRSIPPSVSMVGGGEEWWQSETGGGQENKKRQAGGGGVSEEEKADLLLMVQWKFRRVAEWQSLWVSEPLSQWITESVVQFTCALFSQSDQNLKLMFTSTRRKTVKCLYEAFYTWFVFYPDYLSPCQHHEWVSDS